MKRFLSLILTAILISTFYSCNGVENQESSTQNSESNKTITSTNEIDTLDTSELEYLSQYEMPEASFWRDNTGEYYIYIKEWQDYRKLSELMEHSEFHIRIDKTSIVIDDSTSALAIYIQRGNSDTEIITYHFDRSNEDSRIYTVKLETAILGEVPDYINRPTLIKFISCEVGIISYGYVADWNDVLDEYSRDWNNIFDGTYLTTDGGMTWEKISLENPIPLEYIDYAEVSDFEFDGVSYILSIECLGGHRAKSQNLVDWVYLNYK